MTNTKNSGCVRVKIAARRSGCDFERTNREAGERSARKPDSKLSGAREDDTPELIHELLRVQDYAARLHETFAPRSGEDAV
jgi:hypothetical protein